MRRGVAMLAMVATAGLGVAVMVPPSLASWSDAEYVTAPVSTIECGDPGVADARAWGRVLSGNVLGQPLDPVAAIDGVTVSNLAPSVTSTASSAAATNDLGSDAWSTDLNLAALNLLDIGAGIRLPLGAGTGVYSQYGRTTTTGLSVGAAGAVTSAAGGVASLEPPASATPRQATLRLSDVLGPTPAGLPVGRVADLGLRVGAVGAIASLDACESLWALTAPGPDLTREYLISDLGLDVTSTTIGNFATGLRTSLRGLETSLDALLAPGTSITGSALTSITGVLNGALNLNVLGIGISLAKVNSVKVGVDFDLDPVVALVTGELTDGVVSVNLSTGTVSVDLEPLVGAAYGTADLNGLDPNTSLLTPEVLSAISARVGPLLTGFVTGTIQPALTAALNAATVTAVVDADLQTKASLLITTIDVVGLNLVATITGTPNGFLTGTPAPTVSAVAKNNGGLLNGILSLLGINLANVVNGVQNAVVAPLVSTVVPVIGTAVVAPLMTSATGLANTLVTTLTATTIPAVLTELGGTLTVIGSLVRLTANARPDAADPVGSPATPATGRYFQTALHVGVGPGASLASIYLANASVGPNALR